MRYPGGDKVIAQLIEAAHLELRRTKVPLSESQFKRLGHALNFTLDSMAVCEHPMEDRLIELDKVQLELIKLFKAGEYMPESQTEARWYNAEREVIRKRNCGQPQE